MNSWSNAFRPMMDSITHHGGGRVGRSGNPSSCSGEGKERERKEEASVS